jgi:hypothetical protein
MAWNNTMTVAVWIDYNKDGDFSDAGELWVKHHHKQLPFQVHLL